MSDREQRNNDNELVNHLLKEPPEDMHPGGEPPGRKRKIPWNRAAVVFIIIGAILFGMSWTGGSRGGSIHFRNGGFRVVSISRGAREQVEVALPPGVENARHININAATVNIDLRPAPGSTSPQLFVQGIESPEVTLNGNILTIGNNETRAETFSLINMYFTDARRAIILYLPPRHYEHINLALTSGNVRAEGLHSELFTARSNSGNLTLSESFIETANLRSTAGNIRITDVYLDQGTFQANAGNITKTDGNVGVLSATTTAGNITVNNTHIQNRGTADLRANAGNVRFTAQPPGGPNRIAYELDTRAGNITVNGQRHRGGRYGAVINPVASPDFTVTMRTTSGNVILNLE